MKPTMPAQAAGLTNAAPKAEKPITAASILDDIDAMLADRYPGLHPYQRAMVEALEGRGPHAKLVIPLGRPSRVI